MLRTIITTDIHAVKVFNEIFETLTDNPSLHRPPSLFAIFAAEMEGKVWNFTTSKFEAEDA